ncbi:hypothetical protein [Paraburkholderia sp. SIMBA_030]|uniref:hypothetical protein n=1 Tax=Paraburkholderia sp. SIMBA_030 TaxID=3085773 RepID=UPI00397E323B
MKMKNRAAQFMSTVVVVLAAHLAPSAPTFAQTPDSLYVADVGGNTVKRFGLQGQSLGTFVKSTSGLRGPRGLVFNQDGDLILSDQNVQTSSNSDILEYDNTGQLLRRLVPHSDANAPVASRGVILWRDAKTKQDFMFVADFTTEPQANKQPTPGRLLKYTADGTFAGSFVPDFTFGTCATSTTQTTPAEFHPRAIVLGSDGLLYISNYPCLISGLRGQVLRFNPRTGHFVDTFVDSLNDLNRPEGLVFGPDGNLYITSFRAQAGDTDKILVFQGPTGGSPGAYVDTIDLYTQGDDLHRVYAQALLFGPGGKLFVPISGADPAQTGSVRRYDVSTKLFDVFVASGTVQAGWYLTFGQTNPSTLAYGSK